MRLPERTSSDASALIAGAVYSQDSLTAALGLGPLPAAPDFIELRVDCFADEPGQLDALVRLAPRPFILTVRDPAEGGQGELSSAQRRDLYERFLPVARYVDIELRSLRLLPEIASAAREPGRGLIASFHDFAGMPGNAQLRASIRQAADAGAEICKLAVRVEDAAGLARLIELLAEPAPLPLAVMGMGPFGRVSRLAAAAAGSRINYGYLGASAQVPGQWPVALLRERLDELAG